MWLLVQAYKFLSLRSDQRLWQSSEITCLCTVISSIDYAAKISDLPKMSLLEVSIHRGEILLSF